MALDYEDYLAKHDVDEGSVQVHKVRMLAGVRTYRLRELREQAGFTQAELAQRIGVGRRQVSKIEQGDIDSANVRTIRRYVEAVGGTLSVECVLGDQRVQVG
ncbi:helix-turn-helix domain-containing protein [Arthrobacter sp.]|uniref:helix-turn-helix domain-containing protein n=1 Tax=Arthrobacter sp. TaxID=1667 RepID=UPI003A8DD1DF